MLKSKKLQQLEGIRVGPGDVQPTDMHHVKGVKEGNQPGNYKKSPGHLPGERSNARRSTGINARQRDPILPGMPNLSPP